MLATELSHRINDIMIIINYNIFIFTDFKSDKEDY